MPTVLRSGPYRRYFYSNESYEPPHVHVERDRQSAKLWLEPVELAKNVGFPGPELARIEAILIANREQILEAWHEHFS